MCYKPVASNIQKHKCCAKFNVQCSGCNPRRPRSSLPKKPQFGCWCFDHPGSGTHHNSNSSAIMTAGSMTHTRVCNQQEEARGFARSPHNHMHQKQYSKSIPANCSHPIV
jgi:hypothetical protein